MTALENTVEEVSANANGIENMNPVLLALISVKSLLHGRNLWIRIRRFCGSRCRCTYVLIDEIAFNKLKHANIRQCNRIARPLEYYIAEVPESLSAF